MAVARAATGQSEAAFELLSDALTRAEPERFVRVFLDAGTPSTTLLEAATRRDRTARQASQLLGARTVAATAAAPQRLVDELSSRELEVLRLLRSDLTGPEIAAELLVSVNTLRTHTKNIFMKLGVTSRRAAVRRGDELGL